MKTNKTGKTAVAKKQTESNTHLSNVPETIEEVKSAKWDEQLKTRGENHYVFLLIGKNETYLNYL